MSTVKRETRIHETYVPLNNITIQNIHFKWRLIATRIETPYQIIVRDFMIEHFYTMQHKYRLQRNQFTKNLSLKKSNLDKLSPCHRASSLGLTHYSFGLRTLVQDCRMFFGAPWFLFHRRLCTDPNFASLTTRHQLKYNILILLHKL